MAQSHGKIQNSTPATASPKWWAGDWYKCHPLGRIFFSRPGSRPLYLPSTATLAGQCGVREDHCNRHYWKKQGCYCSRPRHQQGGESVWCRLRESGLLDGGARECTKARGCVNAHCSRSGIFVEKREREQGALKIEEARYIVCYRAKICKLNKILNRYLWRGFS